MSLSIPSEPDQIDPDHKTPEYKNLVTGLILAGGQSTRMGTDKAQIIIHNKPLIEWAIENFDKKYTCVCTSR